MIYISYPVSEIGEILISLFIKSERELLKGDQNRTIQ